METKTMTPERSINELTTAELRELLAQKEANEADERQQKRKDYEVLRDDTVGKLVTAAMQFHIGLKAFKKQTWDDLGAIYKLLQEHSSRHTDGKGNFSIENSQGTMKVTFKRQDNTRFDERATQAERHILDFLTEDFSDPNDPKAKVIRKLLERKKGHVDKDNVLLLISMKDDFPNPHWHRGIDLYQESIVPGETRYYAQFFTRENEGDAWQPIVLDFARVS